MDLPKGSDFQDLRNFVRINSHFSSSKALILPNEKVIGHKMNAHIYKQRFDDEIQDKKIQKYFESIESESIK